MSGSLYVVATPIGNLEDITQRALRVFGQVDLIACEDTRHSKILLDHYGIDKPLISYHQHSELQKIEKIVSELKSGKNIALITDAGTPGVCDPGNVLVEEVLKESIKVIPVPGPATLTTLISVAGMPMDRFVFYGFIPHKKGRRTMIEEIISSKYPGVFYESPHRILKTLEVLKDAKGDIIIGRELTKKFEEVFRGNPKEALEHFTKQKPMGEFVVIFKP